MFFGSIADQEDITKLSLSQFFHDLELLQLDVLCYFIEIASVVLLCLKSLQDGGAIGHSISVRAAE